MLVIPLIIIDVNLDYLSEVVFVRSLLHKVTLIFPIPYCGLEDMHYAAHTQEVKSYVLPP